MNYPLISEYIEAIQDTDNFDKLSGILPVFNDEGKPIMSSGNFAVVFKMMDTKGKLYAVKCFIKEQEGRVSFYNELVEEFEFISSEYIVPFNFYEKELFVDTRQTDETLFPVVVMDWVEGQPLQNIIENTQDYEVYYHLACEFSKLALWLLSQPFAHGDIKPENIIVKDNFHMVLIDYDGMYIPSMKGHKSRELGTQGYTHPFRYQNNIYDEHIDDFSISLIILSLLLLYNNPILCMNRKNNEEIIFSKTDIQSDILTSPLYKKLKETNTSNLVTMVMEVFEDCYKNGALCKNDINKLEVPDLPDEHIIQGDKASTIITDILWKLYMDDYLLNVNITDNELSIENHNYSIKVIPHIGNLVVKTSFKNKPVIYLFTYKAFKRLLLSIGMWDNDLQSKIDYIIKDAQLYMPTAIISYLKTYMNRNYSSCLKLVSIEISGNTITLIVESTKECCIKTTFDRMLTDPVLKRNCWKFSVMGIIIIDINSKHQIHYNLDF